MSWSDGYVTDVAYTFGYYADLSPARVNLALLLAGCPPIPPGPCCELGFGQGVCLAFNAAADPAREWWGTDFNPAHAQHARSLAEAAGVRARLFDQSFEEFAERTDLPPFSYIALHGIWSWVSADNRRHIVDFIRRNLAPGGVLYLSYNTAAGMAAALPLQQLLSAYASRAEAAAVPPPQRMKAALAFAARVFATQPAVVAQTPGLQKRLETMAGQDPVYLLHEYLNANWQPSSFAEVAQAMEGAKLTYAGTAQALDHVPALQLTDSQRGLLQAIDDPLLRQTTRDFVTGQPFRRDLWVRGLRRMSTHSQTTAWRALRVVLVSPMPTEPVKVKGARGEGTVPQRLTQPILDVLAASTGPVALADLERRVVGETYSSAQFADTMLMLLGSGRVEPAHADAQIEAARPHTERLNAHLIAHGSEHGNLSCLISPVSGCGVHAARITQLLIAATRSGCTTDEEYVAAAMRQLEERGEGLAAGGQAITTAAALRDEIARTLNAYREMIPALRRLQIV